MTAKRRVRRSSRGRPLVEAAVLLSIGILFATTWLARWHVILTGSMAPTLLGTHCNVTCGQCGFGYPIDAEKPLTLGARVVCPNCDHTQELDAVNLRSGDRVLVARTIFDLRPPRRWEMVTWRMPDRPKSFGVKRVVGLPGEHILLRHGDVYINGYLVRKTLDEQRAMAILVHDADYPRRNKSGSMPRWHGDDTSRWKSQRGVFRHSADASMTDWLVYHHRQRQGAPGHYVDTPVTDRYGYNQTLPVRELHPTGDLMLTCRLRFTSDAVWSVRALDRKTPLIATFDGAAKQFELRQGFRAFTSQPLEPSKLEDHTLVVSLIDRRYEIALDGRSLYQLDLDTSNELVEPSAEPFAIGALAGDVEVHELRVWRDVYYTVPPVLAQRRNAPPARALFHPYTLGDDEYFLLGDNSPRSMDSRYVSFGVVTASYLVGKPVWEFR
ncbi:MAG TPA: S26 family signal peptidase [Pirellulales bacterium]|nr:S26 family signal peptidase [Pirellulales bacterium]